MILQKSFQHRMNNWEKYLEKIYFDPSHPASFQSPLRLYHTVKKEGKH